MFQENQHLRPGTTLFGGRYRITRFIGAGGFGCTYEAEFVPMRSRVAIKEFFVSSICNREASGVVTLGASSQASLVSKLEEKFRREAQRLFNLKHPGIVSVTDMIEENGTSYYVMDYIDGRSLQSVIDREGPLPEARALKYIGQVMDALEYVHGQNMLHLDIKPDNIMIDANDNVILIDFGVSKQYDEVDGHNTSTIMGQTPGFAPPEQTGNRIRQFVPAADIYALGATLYCALTGSVPPCCADIISGEAELEPLPAGISAATCQAIDAMMQPNVKLRPQSIAAVRALLGMENGELEIENDVSVPTVISDKSIASSTSTTSVSGSSHETEAVVVKPKSKKWLWVSIAAVVVVAVVAAILLTRSAGEAPEEIDAPGVYLACVYKPTGEQRFFTRSEWDGVSSSGKSDYIQLGVALSAEGHKFIVAKADASANEVKWGPKGADVPGLANIGSESAAKADYDGKGNTNTIISEMNSSGKDYPAARIASRYKAASGDSTSWYLPAAGQLILIYKYQDKINDELAHYGMVSIPGEWYWSSTECDASNAWYIAMYSGNLYHYVKNISGRVRAVAPVSLPSNAN